MSEKLVPKALKLKSAKHFFDDLLAGNSTYYMFAANHTPFDDDNSPPVPDNTDYNLHYDTLERMMFLKRITSADIALMVDKNVWTSNTEYQRYDSQLADLEDTDFFVVADEAGSYHIFKCLNNEENASISKPLFSETSEDDNSYIKLVDRYQWKFMYTITANEYNKFATDNFMPCYANVAVANAAVNGAVDVIVIDNPGSDYNSYSSGVFTDFSISGNSRVYAIANDSSSNSSFYNGCSIYVSAGAGAGQIRTIEEYFVSGSQKKIVLDEAFDTPPDFTSTYEITPNVIIIGNGTDAKARATVNTTGNTIDKIEIIEKGQNYTYASIVIVGNTGIINVSSNTAIEANEAVARVIISPPNGHGSNNFSELYADKVGISITFANTEANTLPTTNSFRTIGVLKDPLRSRVDLTIGSANGTLLEDDEIYQQTTGASGVVTFANSTVVKITDVQGTFETGNIIFNIDNETITGNVTAVAHQSDVLDASLTLGIVITDSGIFANGFSLNEKVSQESGAEGYVYFANTSAVKLTRVRGTFVTNLILTGETSSAEANTISVTDPDIIKYSGEVLYIENMEPVQRSNSQSETVKLVISF